MKKLLTITFLLLPFLAAAQLIPIIHNTPPSGYTVLQLRPKKHIEIDSLNNLWMTFASIGLGRYDGSNWIMYDSNNSTLPTDTLSYVELDNNGLLWLGSPDGLISFDGTNSTVYNTFNSTIISDSITCIKAAANGIWIGTYDGVSYYDGSTFMNFNTQNSGLANDSIICINVGNSGNVWIGTRNGLSKYDGLTWTNYDSTNTSLHSNYILSVAENQFGDLWIMPADSRLSVLRTSGIFQNFMEDIYTGALYKYPSLSTLNIDSNGDIYVVYQEEVLKLTASGYFFYPGWSIGSAIYYQDGVFDKNDRLWYINSRIDNAPISSFVIYEISFDNFSLPLGFLTNDNAKIIDINDVSAIHLNRGDMHWDLSNKRYEVPKGSGKGPTFASALWIGGLDSTGQLHLAAQTYRQTGNDYWPGPISGIDIPFDSTSCLAFDKIWSIKKYQIEDFKYNFFNGSVGNGTYQVPDEFLTWPAKGNYHVTSDKAPFFDFNSDGFYNPYDGDYPLIKGDQLLFWIFNDSLSYHAYSGGERIGVEVLASAYAFACSGIPDSNQVLNWTVLYHFDLINQSNIDYDSLYIGLWSDVELGIEQDDYYGCDSALAVGFKYNADNNDDPPYGYGLNPPMMNVKILKGMLADPNDGTDNDLDGVVDELGESTTMNHFIYNTNVSSSPTNHPSSPPDYYLNMKSIWLDGQHLSYGGNGRLGSSGNTGQYTNFAYSGTPYTSQWNEQTVGNTGGSRNFILGSGPVTFPSGGIKSIDFAYIFTWDSLNPNGLTTSIARNVADLQRVQRWFDTDSFPSCEVYTVGLPGLTDNVNLHCKVVPNPAGDFIDVVVPYRFTEATFEISDLTGRVVASGKYHQQEINVNRLPKGIYLIRLRDAQATVTGKFVKL